jgi:hypothetical protein
MTHRDRHTDFWNHVAWSNVIGKRITEIANLSGAEHQQQYLHGGCPECGIFHNPEFSWQHATGCSRATVAEPAVKRTAWEPDHRGIWKVEAPS